MGNTLPPWKHSRRCVGRLGEIMTIITASDAGAAIVRQWATDRAHFLQVLAHLEPEAICQMAQAAVAHCAQRVPWAPVTVDQMLAAWQAAVELEGATLL